MPHNVRNFWVDGRIDGRDTDLSGGPQTKDGGLSINVKQRHGGAVTQALTVEGSVTQDGTLLLTVYDHAGMVVHRHETAR